MMLTSGLALSVVIVAWTLALLTLIISFNTHDRALRIFSCAFDVVGLSFLLHLVNDNTGQLKETALTDLLLLASYFFFIPGIRVLNRQEKTWPSRLNVYVTIIFAMTVFLCFIFPSLYAFALFIIMSLMVMHAEFLIGLWTQGFRNLHRIIRLPVLILIAFSFSFLMVRFTMLLLDKKDSSFFGNELLITEYTLSAVLFALLSLFGIILTLHIASLGNTSIGNTSPEKMTRHDSLTGLLNRNSFEEQLDTELERQDRYQDPLSIIILDIDNFKALNETFGHEAGDRVLRETASRVQKGIRETDLAFRWIGAKILILIPHCPVKGALLLSEKLRKMISAEPFDALGFCTASFGVTSRQQGEKWDHCFNRVELALYEAKRKGINSVECTQSDTVAEEYPRFEWNPAWMSGNTTIDQEHRDILLTGNRILTLSFSDVPEARLQEELVNLIALIENHCNDEERILAEKKYDGLDEHRMKHRKLITDAKMISTKFQNGEIEKSLLFHYIINRLILEHTLTEDSKFFMAFLPGAAQR